MYSIFKSKKWIVCAILSFVVFCVPFIFSACSFAEISSIEIDESTLPKESVEAGTFDVKQLKIILHKTDGTSQVISGDKMMFSTTDYSKLKVVGTQTLTVKYLNKETQFQITIYPVGNPPKYNITFYGRNNNVGEYENVVLFSYDIPIKERLKEIPAVPVVDGYDVVWDKTDFSQTSSNTEVYAIYKVKSYVLTFNPNNGGARTTKDVVYGTPIGTMPVATHATRIFVGWEYNNKFYNEESLYLFTESITLVAKYEIKAAVKVEFYTKVKPPIPTEIFLKQELNLINYDVMVTYNDGAQEIVAIDTTTQNFSSEGFDSSTVGENRELIITYRNPSSATIKTIKLTHVYSVYEKFALSIKLGEGIYEGKYELIFPSEYEEFIEKTKSPFDEKFTNYATGKNIYENNISNLIIKIKPNDGFTYKFVKQKEQVGSIGNLVNITKLDDNEDGYDYYKLSNIESDGTINIQFQQMNFTLSTPEDISKNLEKITFNYVFEKINNIKEVSEISNSITTNVDQKSLVTIILDFKSNVNLNSFSIICSDELVDCKITKNNQLVIKIKTSVGGTQFKLEDLKLKYEII